ncbi:putative bacteriophage protein [Shigella flexneri K-404]|nr:putative bacteriophage protein [Shigella flexneri K-404]
MAKPFTPEQREELKTRIVELVHQDGRVTIRQLSDEQVSVVRLSVAYA